MATNRINRINEDIQRELASLIRTVKDPRVHGLISITRVDTTTDLRYCRVYVSVLDHSDVKEVVKGLKSAAGYLRRELGRVEVRQVYKITGVGIVAGSYVLEGKVTRNAQLRLVRDGIVIHEGEIASLQRFKDSVKEVAAGYECGITLEKFSDLKVGDVLECFEMQEIER